MTIEYTHSERTERKYTVGDAISSASVRNGNRPICLDTVKGRDKNEAITLVELNEIADTIIDDTKYWNS